MSVQGGDSFDHLLVSQLSRKWDYVGPDIVGIDPTYGRFGSSGIRGRGGFSTIGQGMLGKNLGKFYTGWGFFGSAVRHEGMQVSGYTVLHSVYDIASSGAMKLCTLLGADGSLAIGYITVNNFSSPYTILASTAPGQYVAGSHYYFESAFNIKLVGGGAICRIAGNGPGDAAYVSYTGNTVRSVGGNYFSDSTTERFSHVRFGGNIDNPGGGGYTDWDDLYWCDDVDDGILPPTNTFLGDVRLGILRPNGAGAVADFTPDPAVPNWQNVDDSAPDDTTTHVFADTVDQMDLYEMENVPVGTRNIFGLLLNCGVKKDDATARQYSSLVKPSGSGASVVATRDAPAQFTNQQDVSQTNPATGQRWDPAEVNTMQAGFIVEL